MIKIDDEGNQIDVRPPKKLQMYWNSIEEDANNRDQEHKIMRKGGQHNFNKLQPTLKNRKGMFKRSRRHRDENVGNWQNQHLFAKIELAIERMEELNNVINNSKAHGNPEQKK